LDEGLDYISDLAWSRLDEEPADLPGIAENREVFQDTRGLLPPRPSPDESGYENESTNEISLSVFNKVHYRW